MSQTEMELRGQISDLHGEKRILEVHVKQLRAHRDRLLESNNAQVERIRKAEAKYEDLASTIRTLIP